jgi:hypothetical protein
MLSLSRFRGAAWLCALAPCLGACVSRTSSEPRQEQELARAVSAPMRLAPPAYLPAAARAVLQRRMVDHAKSMGDLMNAIMVLSYERIADRAKGVADDANLSRPLTGDATELNSLLPEKFFEYQDALRREARALAAAAGRKSASEVADAYGRLSESCVRCHATYRTGQ